MKLKEILIELKACKPAIDWAADMTIEEVVEKCDRGDWLLWLAQKLEIDKRKLTLAKGKCAKTVIHLIKNERSREAVKAAIDYGNGLIDDKQLKNASDAASAYAAIAYTTNNYNNYTNYATSAYAAYTASDSSYCSAASFITNQQETANICKQIIGQEIINTINQKL